MKAKDAKTKDCPICGFPIVRLGGSWLNASVGGISIVENDSVTIRIEFCTNKNCDWTRKLYRIYPEHKESDWKECKREANSGH
jgi:hypothetical protein